jgi:hypothetical protein
LEKRFVYAHLEARCVCCGGLVDITLTVEGKPSNGPCARDVFCAVETPIMRGYLGGSEKPCSCKKEVKKP